MGKSRLVAEFVRVPRAGGGVVAFGECQAFGTNTSYFVWRRSGARCSASTSAMPTASRSRARARAARDRPRARAARAAARRRARPDDPRQRADELVRREAAQDIARGPARRLPARTRSASEPVVIVLEDCHWIDPLSRDLLEALVRARARRCPCCSCSPTGPRPRRRRASASSSLPQFEELALAELDADDAEQRSIRSKLAQLFGARADAPAALLELVIGARAGQPVLRRGAAQLRPRPGHRPARRGGAPRRSSCRRACTA